MNKQPIVNHAQINMIGKVSQVTLGKDGRTTEGSMGRRWICKSN